MGVYWSVTKNIQTLSKLNLYLILKLQPFFTGFIMGGYLFLRLKKKDSLMVEMMKSFSSKTIAEDIVIHLENI